MAREMTSASNVGTLEATSSEVKKDGNQTNATRRTAGWSHPKEKRPRVQTQPVTRARTLQPPFGRKSHQEHTKQNTRRRIPSREKEQWETIDHKQGQKDKLPTASKTGK